MPILFLKETLNLYKLNSYPQSSPPLTMMFLILYPICEIISNYYFCINIQGKFIVQLNLDSLVKKYTYEISDIILFIIISLKLKSSFVKISFDKVTSSVIIPSTPLAKTSFKLLISFVVHT